MRARSLVYSILLLTCGVVAGMVLTAKLRGADEARAQVAAALAPQAAPAAAAQGAAPLTALPDFSRVAERTVPAVANISSKQIVRRSNSPFANDPFWRNFFGDQD